MTPQEAIETIKIAIAEVEWNYPMEYAVAFENAIESLEKQISKKPTPQVVKGGKRLIGNGWWCKGTTVYKCPCCNSWITPTYKYCINCGQALERSDTNDR